MANFYLVEQRGVPGARLIEAERPASAINHVIDGAFSAKRVDGRELLDAAKLYEVEIAGAKPDPSPAVSAPAGAQGAEGADNDPAAQTGDGSNENAAATGTDADFIAGQGSREEDEE